MDEQSEMPGMFQCRCIVDGWDRCSNDATQEDGLCDWCGSRTSEQLRTHPKAMFGTPGTEYEDHFLGVGGGGEPHALYACWDPEYKTHPRTLADLWTPQ